MISNPKSAAFIGYSEFAQNKGQSLHLTAQLVHSFDEFECFFGGPAMLSITAQLDEKNRLANYTLRKNVFLYDCVKLFFLNGGISCYIVSVGGYEQTVKTGNDEHGLQAGLTALKSCQNVSSLLIPDAVSMSETTNEKESFKGLQQTTLAFCAEQKDLLALLDRQEDPTNAKHSQQTRNEPYIEQIDEPELVHGVIYSPWVKTEFSAPIRLRDLKFECAGKAVSLKTIDPSREAAERIGELDEAINNTNRIKKSIKRRQRGEASLTHRYQALLSSYLAQPASSEENLPLHFLLLFLKGLAEMLNNWICACTLDEVLAGDLVNIIRNTIIPEMATKALPNLIEFHRQAIEADIVDAPVTGYNEMFCLTSCIGSNCPWQKSCDATASITPSTMPAENEHILSAVFDQFDDAIRVIIELSEQFEHDAQDKLLNKSPLLDKIYTTLQRSRYIPPSGVVAGIMSQGIETTPPRKIALSSINGLAD
ncbi:hypothetical protein ACFL2V_02965 [Pseudomonadota bacterium]